MSLVQNLLSQSQAFGSPWSLGAANYGSAATAPDGTSTAIQLVENNANSAHYILQTATSGLPKTLTYSVYLKAGTRSWAILSLNGGGTQTWFDLTNGVTGTVGSGVTATITAVGSSWYRCSITQTLAVGATVQGVTYLTTGNNVTSYAGDNASYIVMWGGQLVQANWAGGYIATTTKPIDNGPIRSIA